MLGAAGRNQRARTSREMSEGKQKVLHIELCTPAWMHTSLVLWGQSDRDTLSADSFTHLVRLFELWAWMLKLGYSKDVKLRTQKRVVRQEDGTSPKGGLIRQPL
jgi:hypothetical protein